MSVLIFRLNNVGFEEAQEVRALLGEHELEYYETSAGMFGISVAGIWLRDEAQVDTARALLDEYQQKRQHRVRYAQQFEQPYTIADRIKKAPLHYLGILIAVGAILYFSVVPFIGLGD